MRKKYDTLLFDLDGVILDFKKAEQLSFRETFQSYGIAADRKLFEIYETINKRRWSLFETGAITKEECTEGRFQELFSLLGMQLSPKDFAAAYQEGLGKGCFLVEGAKELLEELYGGYRMYVVTNGVSSTAYSRLIGTGVLSYFRKVFVSEELGAQKPSMEYFDKVFSDIQDFNRSSTLLIGDTLSSDIQGAKNAGIDCCWVNMEGKENPTELRPSYEIRALRELPPLLI